MMRVLSSVICLLALFGLSACHSLDTTPANSPTSFKQYRYATQQHIVQQRQFDGRFGERFETEANSPQEWRPVTASQPSRGILLVHGLGDSPFSFHDIGQRLAAQGFLVRTVLLPGHGTKVEDLLTVRFADWRQVVKQQTEQLQREVKQVYLGGFSTGANLVVLEALQRDDTAGLLLLSPAFKSSNAYDWLTPWVAPFKPWLREPSPDRPQRNPVRYFNTPTNGFAQYYHSSRAVRHALSAQAYRRPVVMVVAEHDSVVDVEFLAQHFSQHFPHSCSRLLWYGKAETASKWQAPHLYFQLDHLPEQRISQFSHMSVMFSPQNWVYGRQGKVRLCHNGQTPSQQQQCEQGAEVWYSDWGYREADKAHARLTFNPYFDWQMQQVAQVFNNTTCSIPEK